MAAPKVFLSFICLHTKYFTTKELLKVDDLPNYNIFQHFDECVQWIDEGRKQGGVLVHW